jgi:hypothetical protein
MLVSGSFLKSSLENYNKVQSKNKEFYSDTGKAINAGLTASFYAFILVIAVIFFIMELFLLYFAISIAIHCSTSKEERIVNFVMATIFTLPYVLLKTIFDPCSKDYLKNGLKLKF